MTGGLDDFRLRLELARLYELCGPDCVAELLIELGCRLTVRTEVERLLARYILAAGPPEGSA
jgi:hypothetical protein